MFDPKRILPAAGTVVVALAIGMVMQQRSGSEVQTASLGTVPLSDASRDIALSGIAYTSADTVPEETGQAAEHTQGTSEPVEVAAALVGPEPAPPASSAVPIAIEDCTITMSAEARPAAMVALELVAPCRTEERLTLHHNGMMVTLVTDSEGRARALAPALSQQAMFIASFADGDGAVAATAVADIADFDRVVLQWRGNAGFQVHALENGAKYGDAGHVWNGAPQDTARAVSGEGGFLMSIGAIDSPDALVAEVYTYPRGSGDANVALSAELALSDANCDLPLEAQAIQTMQGADLRVEELTLTAPSCDVVGDILMLKNLFQDLKIARN